MVRRQADRLIGSSNVVENLRLIGLIPATESQCRPLTSLTPADQKAVWERVVQKGQKITAELVDQTAKAYLKEVSPEELTQSSGPAIDTDKPQSVEEAFRKVRPWS